jgi:hypothetical protein
MSPPAYIETVLRVHRFDPNQDLCVIRSTALKLRRLENRVVIKEATQ